MNIPEPLNDEVDLGPITWDDNPNTEMITDMLVQRGYDTTSLQMNSHSLATPYTNHFTMHHVICARVMKL